MNHKQALSILSRLGFFFYWIFDNIAILSKIKFLNSFDKEINGLYINLTKISQTSSNSPIYIFKPSSDVMFSFYVHPKDNDVIIVVMETKNVICSFWNDRYAEN
mgnify:CR=1 FL=1